MKKATILIIAILSLSFFHVKGQGGSESNIKVEYTDIKRENGRLTLDMLLNLKDIDIKSQEMLYIFPALRSVDSTYEQSFNPIVITGPKRGKALERLISYEGFEFEETPQVIIPYRKRKNQLYPLKLTIEDQDWLQGASLIFYEDVTGCNCKNEFSNQYTVLTLPSVPRYPLMYNMATDGAKSPISEKYNAHINFVVAKYDILPNFKNNAQVLNEVDRIINNVSSNSDLNITEFRITGYASPEGGTQYNMNLSKNRAESFVRYLKSKYNVSSDKFQVDWRGEDWDGLREVIQNSSIDDKNEILSIISSEQNINTREAKIKQLSGGRTYRTMLRDYYPGLRRNEYVISYVSKNYSVSEAKEVIKTRPELLSLQEMYMVANTYPQDSQEFQDIIRKSVKQYPNDKTALMNSAILSMKNGNQDEAIRLLQGVNTPEAWHNLGIAYYNKGDYSRARIYFQRASDSGFERASSHLRELSDYMGSQNLW